MESEEFRRAQLRNASVFGALLLLGGRSFEVTGVSRSEPEERPCVRCGKPKTHNNAYCSAECCRAHRAMRGSAS